MKIESKLLEHEEAEYVLAAVVPPHDTLVFRDRLDLLEDESYDVLEGAV